MEKAAFGPQITGFIQTKERIDPSFMDRAFDSITPFEGQAYDYIIGGDMMDMEAATSIKKVHSEPLESVCRVFALLVECGRTREMPSYNRGEMMHLLDRVGGQDLGGVSVRDLVHTFQMLESVNVDLRRDRSAYEERIADLEAEVNRYQNMHDLNHILG